MYLKILACDLDGTIAEHGVVAAATWAALRRLKDAGFSLILVTGRTLATFAADGPFADVFEAIVAENGAAVYFTRNDSVVLPFGRVDPEVKNQLKSRRIPIEEGMAIVATWMPHIAQVDEVLHTTGRGATVEYNKGAVMLLPPGATKGTGLTFALNELGFSAHNVVALGDAENDRSLFEVAELSVAVSNAVPEIKDLADHILTEPNGAGFCRLVSALVLDGEIETRPRFDRLLVFGKDSRGMPVTVQPEHILNSNLGIVGGSGSGKSWLAGLVAEELLKHHYQICIIDPEGEYSGLRAFPHSVVLGGPQSRLTPVEDVVTLCEYSSISPIIDLSGSSVEERQEYVGDLLRALQPLRQRRGRPHWFLLDEIHTLCPHDGTGVTDLLSESMSESGYCVVSYRPSIVAPALLDQLDQWLVTRMRWAKELSYLEGYLRQTDCASIPPDRVRSLPLGDAYLCTAESRGRHADRGPLRFRTARRRVPHVRHLHKYLRAPLPSAKRFYFRQNGDTAGRRSAASLWEFLQSVESVSAATLRYHLDRKDFEAWLRSVIHDDELARRLRKIRHRNLEDEFLREAVVDTVAARYEELESLI